MLKSIFFFNCNLQSIKGGWLVYMVTLKVKVKGQLITLKRSELILIVLCFTLQYDHL